MKIYKLKIVEITKYYLVVQDKFMDKGTIHISEVANTFIENLEAHFTIGDTVYGMKISDYRGRSSYSLKKGHHSLKLKIAKENGGGFLGLEYMLQKIGRKYD